MTVSKIARIPMTPLLKVRLLCIEIPGVLRTEGKSFDLMFDRRVVIQTSIASLALRLMRPFDERVKVSAHVDLTVSDNVREGRSRHWSVIRCAECILAQCIEAVVNMMRWDLSWLATLPVDESFPERPLLALSGLSYKALELKLTRQCRLWKALR